jgi:hypothetical protein
MSEQTIKLCSQIGKMVTSYNVGELKQTKWGQGYAVLFLGMAHQMHSMDFNDWCGSGRGKGLAMDQVNGDVKKAISNASSTDGTPDNATIKTASLSVSWSLGVTAARDEPAMGLTFTNPLPNSESKGSIKVDLDKLKAWVKNGGILQRNTEGSTPVKWKQAKARANALIKSLDSLTVGDFPTDEGLPQLKDFNSLLGTLRAMETMVNGIITPAEIAYKDAIFKVVKPTPKKRATRKAA